MSTVIASICDFFLHIKARATSHMRRDDKKREGRNNEREKST